MKTLDVKLQKLSQDDFALVTQRVDSANNSIEINSIIENLVTSQLGAEFSSIWFYDEKSMVFLRERDNGHLRELPLELKKGIIYKCFMTKEGKIYNYLASDKDYIASIDNPDNIKIKSKIILPLIDNNKFIGLVTAYSSIENIKIFTKNDMDILKALSPYIINSIYKMHFPQNTSSVESLTISNIKEIQESQKIVETPDKTLNVMANFIHDIRTPSNTLYGFLELLEEQITDKRLKNYIMNAKESANFINELTTSMLDRISLQRESEEYKVKEIDTVKFFSDISEMFVSNMCSKDINFIIYIDPLLPKVIELDDLKLKRILINLIGNAYKFTPNNKHIEFSVIYDAINKKIKFFVKDAGIGISKENQKKIFKAFKQVDDTTSLNYGGTGLGLSICSEYVNDLGGKLKVKSELGKGTLFFFELTAKIKDAEVCFKPIKKSNTKISILTDSRNSFNAVNLAKYMIRMGIDKDSIIIVSSISKIPSDTTNLLVFQNKIKKETQELVSRGIKTLIIEEELFSIQNDEMENSYSIISKHGYFANELYEFINIKKIPKVLIVDDDKVSVLLLQKILENEYCEIDVARNGKVALEMLIDSHKKQNPYSVVYIDNHMPLMSGLEVMKKFRQFESDNKLKNIYSVSTSGNGIDLEKDDKSFNIYVGKPFKVDDIRKALRY